MGSRKHFESGAPPRLCAAGLDDLYKSFSSTLDRP